MCSHNSTDLYKIMFKKTTVLNTLVMVTMASDIENNKSQYHIFTCKFPISSLQYHDLRTL